MRFRWAPRGAIQVLRATANRTGRRARYGGSVVRREGGLEASAQARPRVRGRRRAHAAAAGDGRLLPPQLALRQPLLRVHEVCPVEHGTRVTITYSLLVGTPGAIRWLDPAPPEDEQATRASSRSGRRDA